MKIARLSSLLVACLVAVTSLLPAEKPMRLAVMAFSFNADRGTFYDSLEKAAKVGVQYIEISPGQMLSATEQTKMENLSDAQIELAVTQAAKIGVKPISIYLTIPNDETRARACFTLAKKLGVENITTESVGSIDLIEKLVKEFDLTIAFHAHVRKPKDKNYWIWNPDYLYGFLQGRDSRVGACAETGHWATSGVDSLKAVALLEARVKSVHLKDRPVLGQPSSDVVYGAGKNQIADLLAEFNRQKNGTILIVEYESNIANNIAEVSSCVKFVHDHLPKGAIQ